ncbi:MAG: PIN domain-containing protein [Chromatiales bacterium]
MSAEFFLDTNLFIYQLEALDDRKFAIAERIIRAGVATGNACISFQVVQECLNTVLRKAEIPLDGAGAGAYLDTVLTPLFRVPASVALYQRSLDIHTRYRYGFYDALIVAAALEAGCTRLYSEDLQHGQQFDRLTIENPFL